MTQTKQPSPVGEGSALTECEAIIQDGMTTFLAVGNALVRIRDEQLYLGGGYTSFDQYCRERWDMSGSHAYRLIDASETVRELPPGTPLPANEAQARELKVVAPEARAEVMQEASEATGGNLTAKAITDAATKAADPDGMLPLVRAIAIELDRYHDATTTTITIADLVVLTGSNELNGEEPEESAVRRVIRELGDQVVMDGDAVRLAKAMQHDRKSNPPGLFWNGSFIKIPAREDKASHKPKEPSSPTRPRRTKLSRAGEDLIPVMDDIQRLLDKTKTEDIPDYWHDDAMHARSFPLLRYLRATGSLGSSDELTDWLWETAAELETEWVPADGNELEAAAHKANRLDDALEALQAKAREAAAEVDRLKAEAAAEAVQDE